MSQWDKLLAHVRSHESGNCYNKLSTVVLENTAAKQSGEQKSYGPVKYNQGDKFRGASVTRKIGVAEWHYMLEASHG